MPSLCIAKQRKAKCAWQEFDWEGPVLISVSLGPTMLQQIKVRFSIEEKGTFWTRLKETASCRDQTVPPLMRTLMIASHSHRGDRGVQPGGRMLPKRSSGRTLDADPALKSTSRCSPSVSSSTPCQPSYCHRRYLPTPRRAGTSPCHPPSLLRPLSYISSPTALMLCNFHPRRPQPPSKFTPPIPCPSPPWHLP